MSIQIKLRGVEALRRKIRALAAKTPDKALAALYTEGEKIMTRSKRDYVPIEFSALKNSGHVRATRAGRNLEVELSFGDTSAPYALTVHEHPSMYDPPSWTGPVRFQPEGRGPKYLKKPMDAAMKGMAERIAAALGRTLIRPGGGV